MIPNNKAGRSLYDNDSLSKRDSAFREVSLYDRKLIGYHRLNIAERDCFYVSGRKFGLYIAVCDRTLTGYMTIILADFDKMTVRSRTITRFFPFGRMNMPKSPYSGDIVFANDKCGASIVSNGNEKYIKCEFLDFYDHKNLYINLTLNYDTSVEALSSAEPGDNRFEHRCLCCGLAAKGVVRLGGDEYTAEYGRIYAYHSFERGNNGLDDYDACLYANYYIKHNTQFAMRLNDSGGRQLSGDNYVMFDRRVNKLGKIRTAHNRRAPKSKYEFNEMQHALSIAFTPLDNNRDDIMRATAYDRMVIFGRVEGDMILNGNTDLGFDRLPAIMEVRV